MLFRKTIDKSPLSRRQMEERARDLMARAALRPLSDAPLSGALNPPPTIISGRSCRPAV